MADLDGFLEHQVLTWAAACDDVQELVDNHVADFGDIVIGDLASEVSPLVSRHIAGLLLGLMR